LGVTLQCEASEEQCRRPCDAFVSEVRKASGIDTRAVRRFREKLCRVAVYSVDGKSKCESIGSKKKKKKKREYVEYIK
jgi:hypothetical protein